MNKENLIYGQLFGYARKQSAVKIMNEKLYPRHLCQYALSNISPESRFTGNRQNVPTANAARTLSYQTKSNKLIIECIYIAIATINENYKSKYINENREATAKKVKMWKYIQLPIKIIPLLIFLLNETLFYYYHMFADKDSEVFIDYIGSLVR